MRCDGAPQTSDLRTLTLLRFAAFHLCEAILKLRLRRPNRPRRVGQVDGHAAQGEFSDTLCGLFHLRWFKAVPAWAPTGARRLEHPLLPPWAVGARGCQAGSEASSSFSTKAVFRRLVIFRGSTQ